MNRSAFTGRFAYTLISSLVVVIIAALSWQRHPTSDNQPQHNGVCDVIRIIDGDTIIVSCAQQKHILRLMHIDAPEIAQSPWGERAKRRLQQLAQQRIYVEFHGRDVYHRDLAVIAPADNHQRVINLALVAQGEVRVYSRYHPPAQYVDAMKMAKANHDGIWQQKGLHQDPARYRRLTH